VCIKEYLAGSSITTSTVRGITLDKRHAVADQIKAVSLKSKGKIIPMLQKGNVSSPYIGYNNIHHHMRAEENKIHVLQKGKNEFP